jgi:hypothetical protein
MNDQTHNFPDTGKRSERLEQIMAMQAIEGNPLDAEDIAMFEMFEREGWSHDQRRAHILAQIKAKTVA